MSLMACERESRCARALSFVILCWTFLSPMACKRKRSRCAGALSFGDKCWTILSPMACKIERSRCAGALSSATGDFMLDFFVSNGPEWPVKKGAAG
jgi:hypothetical protein